ncbi:MAG: type VI secretion protein IcmF/TssM N-terminal domain-containing protein [Desulfovibrionaceae bacterium]|nr:type VI secretion protein IcmF/TssM N-terminal domain-containing protein [Desulfovibrionaceae bacterium]
MRFLGKILVWLFWLFLVAVLLTGLTVLAWWMGWPLATGVVILLGGLGLGLAFLGLRALLRWRDKNRFVRKVLDEQAQSEQPASLSGGRVADVWRQGMEALAHSPQRFAGNLHGGRPCFMALDSTKAASSLLTSFGSTVPEQPDAPLYWHFLASSLVLRCPDRARAEGDWEELLSLLTRDTRKLSLRGIVLLLSLPELGALSDEELCGLGQRLRSRVQQTMLALGRHYPVFVLVEGLESLPGMEDVLQTVDPSDQDMPLGLMLGEEVEGAGRLAADAAARFLEQAVRAAAASGNDPHGDMLKALREIRLFGDRLELVLENLYRDTSHQVTPLLRGVFFCQSQPSNQARRPAFIGGLLSRVLQQAGPAAGISGGLPFQAATKIMIMAAWLLSCLFVCGLIGVNTVYQYRILNIDTASDAPDISHNALYNSLYEEMTYIQRIEEARKAWFLPMLGQDRLSLLEQKAKEHFVLKVHARILNPMMASFQSFYTNTSVKKNTETDLDVVQELTWLCGVLSDRVEQGKLSQQTAAFPLTRHNEAYWDPILGQLIGRTLDWMPDGDQLNALSQGMRFLLSMSFTRQKGYLLTTLVENVNRDLPTAEICLSRFWPHIDESSGGDRCIPAAYTATGYGAIRGMLEDIESIGDSNETLRQQLVVFQDAYFKRYTQLWHDFATAFEEVGKTLLQGDISPPMRILPLLSISRICASSSVWLRSWPPCAMQDQRCRPGYRVFRSSAR